MYVRSKECNSPTVIVKNQPKKTPQAIAWFVNLIKKYIGIQSVPLLSLKDLIRAFRDNQTIILNRGSIQLIGKVDKVGMYLQCAIPPTAEVVVEDTIGD